MLYFMIILLPFIFLMVYLIYQNRKLKNQYEGIVQKLYMVKKASGLERIEFPMGINRDLVVTNNAIKRLENYLMAFEDYYEVKRKVVVSNTYGSYSEKLKNLEMRAVKLEKVISGSEQKIIS